MVRPELTGRPNSQTTDMFRTGVGSNPGHRPVDLSKNPFLTGQDGLFPVTHPLL